MRTLIPNLPPIYQEEPLYARELEEELLQLQDRVGLSTIVVEDRLFTQRRTRRAVSREVGAGDQEQQTEAANRIYGKYREYLVRYRRATLLGNAA